MKAVILKTGLPFGRGRCLPGSRVRMSDADAARLVERGLARYPDEPEEKVAPPPAPIIADDDELDSDG